MNKNIIQFIVDENGQYISIPVGTVKAKSNLTTRIQLVTPISASTAVNYLIYDSKNIKKKQYLIPTGDLGSAVVDPSNPNHQLVAGWKVYEADIYAPILSVISKYRTGKVGMSFEFVEQVPNALCTNFVDYFGFTKELPETASDGDYYICEDYNFWIEDNLYNKGDILVWYGEEWHNGGILPKVLSETVDISDGGILPKVLSETVDISVAPAISYPTEEVDETAFGNALGEIAEDVAGIDTRLNGVEADLNGKQDKVDALIETTDKTVVGAINELNSGVNLAINTAGTAKDIAEGIDGKAEQALTESNDAKIKSEQAISTANSARLVAEGIDDKATSALSTSATALDTANEAHTIAIGASRAIALDDEAALLAYISDPTNKDKHNVGDAIYLKQADMPDYWITEVLDIPNASGYYYEIEPLESKLPDITNMVTTDTEQTITKSKNFTDGLKKNGVDVAVVSDITKENIGLDNVDNTSDQNKPISNATQQAIDELQTEVAGKEDAFEKNTAFNKDFGTDAENIAMNGQASVGVSENVSREDHAHPSDTTKADDSVVVKITAQELTEAEKAQARSNIGAGESGFSGDYDDLSNKPIIRADLSVTVASGELLHQHSGASSGGLISGSLYKANNGDWELVSVGKEYIDNALGLKADDNAVVKISGNQTVAGQKTFSDNATFKGNVLIEGDITQSGASYETHAEQVYTTKDEIVLRDGATAGLGSGEAGFTFKKAASDGVSDIVLKVKSDGILKVGKVGNTQPLATREETPLNGGFARWNATAKRFEAVGLKQTTGQSITDIMSQKAVTDAIPNMLKDPDKTYLVVRIPTDNDEFTLETGRTGSPNYTIEWGDGSSEDVEDTSNPTHTYEKAGMYIITISGDFTNGFLADFMLNVNQNKMIEVYGGNNYPASIAIYAFRNCPNLTTAIFPNVTHIEGYAFENCTNLTEAIFPKVTSIGSATFPNSFNGCTNLTEAIFPKVTSIGSSAFSNCSNLTTANFPSVTSIAGGAFSNCTNLKELTLGNIATTATGTRFGNVKLVNLTIAQDVTDSDINRIKTFYAANGGTFTGNETKHALQVEKTPTADNDVVNKIYLDTNIVNSLNNKVDKVPGKQLSTEDYSTTEKNKLAGLSNYNDTQVKTDINTLFNEKLQVSSSGSNYIKFSNGFIIQWGDYSLDQGNNATKNITFPTPFSTTNYGVVTSHYQGNVSNDFINSFKITAKATTYFTVKKHMSETTEKALYIAVGK